MIAGRHIMKVMRRHVLRMVLIGAVLIAIPQLASAFDSETGATSKFAMGPTSAPQKQSGAPATPDHTITTCKTSERPCPKPHHHGKHRHAASAARPK